MPTAADIHNHSLRLMLYGEEKTKKTWWACKAAEAGYNVLLLDTDDGYQITAQIQPEAQKRIHILPISDGIDATAAIFTTLFLKGVPFNWDPSTRRLALPSLGRNKPEELWQIKPTALDKSWVVVLDSWTAVAVSLIKHWYNENKVDMADAKKHERPCYGYASMMANWMLSQLKSVSQYTNVIVIGHETVYEKYKTVVTNGKKVQELEWAKTIIKSTSNPHGKTLGADFTDILYFSQNNNNFFISTAKGNNQPGGCRSIAPGSYKWEELTFAALAKKARMPALITIDTTLEPIKVVKNTQDTQGIKDSQSVAASPSNVIKQSTGKTMSIL